MKFASPWVAAATPSRGTCQNLGMSERVTISISDGIADVRFDRVDKRNALDGEMFSAIAAAGERLKTEPGVRVVVISGNGPSFCAGLDFSTFESMAGGETADTPRRGNPGQIEPGQITHLGQQVAWVWQEVPVPVIAAVHGHALGGGLQIALGADIRIVHPDTQMSVREVYWGLVPDMTGTFVLSQLVRPDIAKELTFTARVFSGAEAHQMGLATRLSDQPLHDAMVLAAQIAGNSPGAVKGSKDLFNRMYTDGAAAQFAAERAVIAAQIGSPNQVEAVMAGFEKRTPVYTD
jgi:enoyl-CoA hydratase/carnithine racemase